MFRHDKKGKRDSMVVKNYLREIASSPYRAHRNEMEVVGVGGTCGAKRSPRRGIR